MILIGRDLSPFVRRTATVIEMLELPYERRKLATADADAAKEVAKINPLSRVPALILDDGEVLIDSAAIIDYVLEIGDPDGNLLPANGAARREVLRLSAFATGVMEKGVAAAYERSKRPKELMHEPWRQYLRSQISEGLAVLEAAATGKTWLTGEAPSLADINAVVAYDYIGIIHPKQLSSAPNALPALSERANELASFANTKWQG